MRIAVISDIHSNLEALTTALETAHDHKVEAIYCLGDVVGYGADPAACVDLVRRECAAVVRGNHDEAVALERGLSFLPKNGKEAAIHNRAQLSAEQLEYLANLPFKFVSEPSTFVHATPREPESWIRLDSFLIAHEQFAYFSTPFCFVGHTHIAGVMADRLGVLRVRPGHRYIINAGSVGQPRDGNPRLSMAVCDTEAFTCELLRVPYDVDAAAAKIREAGLPGSLADRLKRGS